LEHTRLPGLADDNEEEENDKNDEEESDNDDSETDKDDDWEKCSRKQDATMTMATTATTKKVEDDTFNRIQLLREMKRELDICLAALAQWNAPIGQ